MFKKFMVIDLWYYYSDGDGLIAYYYNSDGDGLLL